MQPYTTQGTLRTVTTPIEQARSTADGASVSMTPRRSYMEDHAALAGPPKRGRASRKIAVDACSGALSPRAAPPRAILAVVAGATAYLCAICRCGARFAARRGWRIRGSGRDGGSVRSRLRLRLGLGAAASIVYLDGFKLGCPAYSHGWARLHHSVWSTYFCEIAYDPLEKRIFSRTMGSTYLRCERSWTGSLRRSTVR